MAVSAWQVPSRTSNLIGMNAPHDVDRRLILVENDTVHIYDLIDERTKRLTSGLSEVRTTQAEHSVVLAEHTQRLDHIDTTLDEILRRLPEPSA